MKVGADNLSGQPVYSAFSKGHLVRQVLNRVAAILSVLLFSTQFAPAQDFAPDFKRLQQSLLRIENGDSSDLARLETSGRQLLIWAAQRRVTGEIAHLVGKVGLTLGAPLAHPDSAISRRETFWRGGAVRALHSALAANPADTTAALMLESIEPYPHLWTVADKQLRQLRALDSAHATLPGPLEVARIELELERGDPESAASLLAQLAPSAISQSRRHHLAAQVDFALGDSLAPHHYYAGSGAINTLEEMNIFRADLAWIAEPQELAEWDALSPGSSEHTTWLRRFWTRRDLTDARLPGSRLREHFARWRVALRDYRWDPNGVHALGIASSPGMGSGRNHGDIAYPVATRFSQARSVYQNRLVSLSRVLDDRGAIVMRHGAPDMVARMPGITALDQAVLKWTTPDGPLIVGFSKTGDEQGFDAHFGMVARNIPTGDLMAGCSLDSSLCALAGLVASALDPAATELQAESTRKRYQTTREIAETTEGNPQRFLKPIVAYVQAYGIPGGGVLVSYAIPVDQLGDTRSTTLRAVIGDAAGEIVVAVDSIRRWPLGTTADQSYLNGFTVLQTPPGNWQVGIVLSDSTGERGHGARFLSVPAIAVGGTQLALSDPIIGRENSGLTWGHNGASISLNPTGAWLATEAGVLSVEAYGLIPDRDYLLTLEITTSNDASAPADVSISEPVRSDASRLMIQRTLSFANLKPGTYKVTVRITDVATGVAASRQRKIPIQ